MRGTISGEIAAITVGLTRITNKIASIFEEPGTISIELEAIPIKIGTITNKIGPIF